MRHFVYFHLISNYCSTCYVWWQGLPKYQSFHPYVVLHVFMMKSPELVTPAHTLNVCRGDEHFRPQGVLLCDSCPLRWIERQWDPNTIKVCGLCYFQDRRYTLLCYAEGFVWQKHLGKRNTNLSVCLSCHHFSLLFGNLICPFHFCLYLIHPPNLYKCKYSPITYFIKAI